MLITDLRKETDGDHAGVRARVVWEDAQRQPLDLEIRTDAAHGAAMRADPSALLVACIVPADRDGEGQRRRLDLEIRTDAGHGAAMRADPSALLVACIVPAYRYGEGRVRVEGQVCPLLRGGVLAALKTLAFWYPGEFAALPAIEASGG